MGHFWDTLYVKEHVMQQVSEGFENGIMITNSSVFRDRSCPMLNCCLLYLLVGVGVL